jgi:hypothetical protein
MSTKAAAAVSALMGTALGAGAFIGFHAFANKPHVSPYQQQQKREKRVA